MPTGCETSDRLKSLEVSPRSSAGEGSIRRSPSDSRSISTPGSRKGVSPRSRLITSATSPISPKDFLKRLVDRESFNASLQSWLQEKLSIDDDGYANCEPPFQLEEIHRFDYAIEGVLFQQLQQMPSVLDKAEMCGATEDLLYASVESLWRSFWSSEEPLPLFVTSHGFDLKQSSRDKRGKSTWPRCAAVIGKSSRGAKARWEHIGALALVKDDLGYSPEQDGILPPPDAVGDALFFGLQMLLSRSYAGRKCAIRSNQDIAYVILVDSQCGVVVRLKGDVSKMDTNSHKVYEASATWVQEHAHVSVSNVYQVWNRLGNVNWRDVGALHLLATLFSCLEQLSGLPKRSIAQATLEHSRLLQHRRIERGLQEDVRENGSDSISAHHGEITEIEEAELEHPEVAVKEMERMKLEPGTVLWLEDSTRQRGFEIHEDLGDGQHSVYSATSLDEGSKPPLNVYVGAHPSQLEPSWEDMSTWYQVQRQTRVLNIMKQRGVLSKYLPQLVASGRILHPGTCTKQSPAGRCEHPWCGTPVLVTSPTGQTLETVFQRQGLFTTEEALKLCRDALSALQSASSIGIQHGDIAPNHVICATGADGENFYVLVEWGHAVLEDRDSPVVSLSFSSTYALQEGKLCPASDAESLIYLLFFVCGGAIPQFDSIESALQWRERSWARRLIQQHLGEISAVLKAFADYVDSLCGTPYPVDYNIWLRRLCRSLHGEDPSKGVEHNLTTSRIEDIAGSSGS